MQENDFLVMPMIKRKTFPLLEKPILASDKYEKVLLEKASLQDFF